MLLFSFVFFFKQKTAYEMRISDWSSDVCSSDLPGLMESAFDEEIAGRGQYMLPPRRRAGFPHSCDRIVFCHHTSLVDCSERMGSVREVLQNRLRSEAVMAGWCCSTSPRRPDMTKKGGASCRGRVGQSGEKWE